MDVRDRYEAQQLERRRMALALRRGTQHDSLLRETHPHRYVLGGIGIALLALLGAAITGLVSPRAPDGWDDPGRLVLDKDSGQRYVVDPARVLRPVLNDTSLRLVFPGSVPAAVEVADELVRDARRGQPVGRTDVPFEPPALLPDDAPSQRCQAGDKAVVVRGAAPGDDRVDVLVRSADRTGLLTGGRLLPIPDDTALGRLGWSPAQALPVAPVVLEAVAPGPALAAVTVGAGDPAAPALQREGTLLTGVPSGASYVVTGGVLRALPHRTAVQLVFGPQPPAPVQVSDAEVATAPKGEPVVPGGVPEAPPALSGPPPGGVLCVDGGGVAHVAPVLPASVALPAGATGFSSPQGTGVLVATDPKAVQQPSEQAPVLLFAGGLSYAIPSSEVLQALGYTPADVRLVTPAYAQLPPPAAPLQPIKVLP